MIAADLKWHLKKSHKHNPKTIFEPLDTEILFLFSDGEDPHFLRLDVAGKRWLADTHLFFMDDKLEKPPVKFDDLLDIF